MKIRAILSLAILLCGGLAASAQTFTNWGTPEITSVLRSNVFDSERSFSAVAEVRIENDSQWKIDAGISAQDGNVRIYVDIGTLEIGSLPKGLAKPFLEIAKKDGLSRSVVLFRKGDATRYDLYPDRRVYHTNAVLSLMTPIALTSPGTLKPVPAGEETLEGHVCRKIELRMTVGKETETILTIWRAKDMADFPVKLRLGDLTVTIKQIKFAALNPGLFEIPAGYRRLDSIVAIIVDAEGGNKTPEPDTKAARDARVLKWHQELADRGDRYGQYLLGLRYRNGDGVEKDLNKARDLLQKSADQGDRDAIAALAKLPPDRRVSDITIVSAAFGVGNRQADVTGRLVDLLRAQPGGFTVSVGTLQTNVVAGKRHRLTIQYDFKGEHYSFAMQAQNSLSYQTLIKNAQE